MLTFTYYYINYGTTYHPRLLNQYNPVAHAARLLKGRRTLSATQLPVGVAKPVQPCSARAQLDCGEGRYATALTLCVPQVRAQREHRSMQAQEENLDTYGYGGGGKRWAKICGCPYWMASDTCTLIEGKQDNQIETRILQFPRCQSYNYKLN